MVFIPKFGTTGVSLDFPVIYVLRSTGCSSPLCREPCHWINAGLPSTLYRSLDQDPPSRG